MTSFVRRLLGDLVPPRAARTRRRMTIETCEARRMLCDDLTMPPSPPPPPPAEPPGEIATAPVPATPPDTAPPPIAVPPPDAAPPAAAPANQAPVITDLAARPLFQVAGGTLWEITGKVSDDKLSEGVAIIFSGLLQGRNIAVDSLTGSFLTTAIILQGDGGMLGATALDSQFSASTPRTLMIP